MFNYSKRNMIIISIILSLIVLILINFILIKFKESQKKKDNFNSITNTNQINSGKSNNSKEKYEVENINNNGELEGIITNQYMENSWRILIPKINLDAPILEGTSSEILRKGVGHFEETSNWNGNVCLAAHNRGYKYNYFQEIKRLEIGDTIVYLNNNDSRTYAVTWKGKIKETDLSCLKDTKENTLTLLTCVENMPEYRLCVQACEINTI